VAQIPGNEIHSLFIENDWVDQINVFWIYGGRGKGNKPLSDCQSERDI